MSDQDCRKAFEEWARTVPFTHSPLMYDCDAWIGWQAAWNRRQSEAKPMTVEQIAELLSKTSWNWEHDKENQTPTNRYFYVLAEAIHAALPWMPSREEVETIRTDNTQTFKNALTKIEEQAQCIEEMREALEYGYSWFAEYATYHAINSKKEKSERNRTHAEKLRAVLEKWRKE